MSEEKDRWVSGGRKGLTVRTGSDCRRPSGPSVWDLGPVKGVPAGGPFGSDSCRLAAVEGEAAEVRQGPMGINSTQGEGGSMIRLGGLSAPSPTTGGRQAGSVPR